MFWKIVSSVMLLQVSCVDITYLERRKTNMLSKQIITFAMKLCSYVILNLCKLLNLMFVLPNSKFG